MDTPRVITVSLNPAIDRIIEVPNLKLGDHQMGHLVARLPAGKAVNVSRALSILGVSSVATGFMGIAEVDFFHQSFDGSSIQDDFLAVTGSTRENITLVDPVTHHETHIRDVGFEVDADDLACLAERLRQLCSKGSTVVFSGAMPRGCAAANFVELIQVCLTAGARVAVDTSGEALKQAARLPLWLIKPNEAELAEIVGAALEGGDRVLAAGGELARHIGNVLVSCGSDGSLCYSGGAIWRGHVSLDASRVCNTVGCGDCLLAGFVAGCLRGDEPAGALRLALATATAKAVSLESGRFTLADVEDFSRFAAIEPVAS